MLRQSVMILDDQLWFFVASYVVTDKNKLTKRDVNNDISHLLCSSTKVVKKW